MERLFAKKPEELERMKRIFRQKARQLDLPLGDMEMMYNSRPAQELRLWAEACGAGDAFSLAVYKAYFAGGQNIARADVLAGIAEAVGLCPDTAKAVLAEGRYQASVKADWACAEENAVPIIPALMIGENKLAGVHSYEKIAAFLEANAIRRS